jgi:hypothetical protein
VIEVIWVGASPVESTAMVTIPKCPAPVAVTGNVQVVVVVPPKVPQVVAPVAGC